MERGDEVGGWGAEQIDLRCVYYYVQHPPVADSASIDIGNRMTNRIEPAQIKSLSSASREQTNTTEAQLKPK